jgi:hypothetical protein
VQASIQGEQERTLRGKLLDWLHRYGIAECVGISCALLGSYVARRVTGNAIAAAYGGAWGESLGYSSVIIARDMLASRRAARVAGRGMHLRDAGTVATGLITEFGPAGVIDTFVSRPLAMGIGARLLGPEIGLVAGKLAADVLFYIPVIVMYERGKRLRERAAKS